MDTALAVGAVLAALAALLLRGAGENAMASAVTAVALLGVLGCFVGRLGGLWRELAALFDGAARELLPSVFKMLGVAWLAQIGADLCREFGSPTVAGYVEGVGKVELLLLALPLLKEVVDLAGGLFS
jgi:stage III sporulation protein AD